MNKRKPEKKATTRADEATGRLLRILYREPALLQKALEEELEAHRWPREEFWEALFKREGDLNHRAQGGGGIQGWLWSEGLEQHAGWARRENPAGLDGLVHKLQEALLLVSGRLQIEVFEKLDRWRERPEAGMRAVRGGVVEERVKQWILWDPGNTRTETNWLTNRLVASGIDLAKQEEDGTIFVHNYVAMLSFLYMPRSLETWIRARPELAELKDGAGRVLLNPPYPHQVAVVEVEGCMTSTTWKEFTEGIKQSWRSVLMKHDLELAIGIANWKGREREDPGSAKIKRL